MTVFETIVNAIMDTILLDDNELAHLQELKLSEESVAEVCGYLKRPDFPDRSIVLIDNSTYQVIGIWDSLFQMLNRVSGEILEGTVHDRFLGADANGDFDEMTWMISHVDLANADKYDPELMWEIAHSGGSSIDLTTPEQTNATTSATSVFTESDSENLLKQYQAIGTLEEFKKLKQRDIAQGIEANEFCPFCGYNLKDYVCFCTNCGQRLFG